MSESFIVGIRKKFDTNYIKLLKFTIFIIFYYFITDILSIMCHRIQRKDIMRGQSMF